MSVAAPEKTTLASRAAVPDEQHARGVRVQAHARLHLGFLDPSASLGRRFGSIGLSIQEPSLLLRVQALPGTDRAQGSRGEGSGRSPAADQIEWAEGPKDVASHREDAAQRIAQALAAVRSHLRVGESGAQGIALGALRVVVERVIPPHAGFGSGTQLALSAATAAARMVGRRIPTATLAAWTGRGVRSGVGIAAFDSGGLLLDGGPSADGTPAPLLSRMALPEAWRIVLVQVPGAQGMSGAQEKAAIATLDPLPRERAAQACHQTLMQVLPGAATNDFPTFAHGLMQVQSIIANHFAPAQGGSAWTHAGVGRLLQAAAAQASLGPIAVGQSSWGPTGFAFVPSAAHATQLIEFARSERLIAPDMTVQTVAPCNAGASIQSLS